MPAETILASSSNLSMGGKGLNQAVSAVRAGSHVCMIGCVGSDRFGDMALNFLSENSIGTSLIKARENIETGAANILVSAEGQNMIAVCPGANSELMAEDISEAREQILGCGLLLAQLEIPVATVRKALSIANHNQIPSILNPAPALKSAADLLSMATLITPNETETQEFTGILPQCYESAIAAEQELQKLGAKSIVITMGDKGCFVSGKGQRELIPAYPVTAVDTTGAGDVFSGVLASCLAAGSDLFSAARMASAAAAISVTRKSAQGSAPTCTEIKNFISEQHQNNVAI